MERNLPEIGKSGTSFMLGNVNALPGYSQVLTLSDL